MNDQSQSVRARGGRAQACSPLVGVRPAPRTVSEGEPEMTSTEHRFAQLARLSAAALVAGAGSGPGIQLSETLAELGDSECAEAHEYIREHEEEELGRIQARMERHERMQREIDAMDGDGDGYGL